MILNVMIIMLVIVLGLKINDDNEIIKNNISGNNDNDKKVEIRMISYD